MSTQRYFYEIFVVVVEVCNSPVLKGADIIHWCRIDFMLDQQFKEFSS